MAARTQTTEYVTEETISVASAFSSNEVYETSGRKVPAGIYTIRKQTVLVRLADLGKEPADSPTP